MNDGSLETSLESTRDLTEAFVLTYLGQVGFAIQHRGVTIVIDPYLTHSGDSDPTGAWRRNYPPPVTPDNLRGVNLVLCTHDHLDHTDPDSLRGIASASPEAFFAAPRKSAQIITDAGISRERVITLEAGKSRVFGDVTVEPLAAAHEEYECDADGHYTHLCYVLRWAGRTFFHAGDTTVQPQLSADLTRWRVDVGFLPINGRSVERNRQGIVGNMDGREAADFAHHHKLGLVIPTHYDLYPNNGASLADFVHELESLDPKPRFKAFRPGEQLLYPVREP